MEKRQLGRGWMPLLGVVLLGVLAAALFMSGCEVGKSDGYTSGNSFYLYVGLTDATTGKQELTMDQGLAKVKETMSAQKAGGTVVSAWGDFLDDKGSMVSNDTILVITSTEENEVSGLVEALRKNLNVSTVYVEKYSVQHKIYGGQL